MRTTIISSLAAATLLLSACGGGTSGAQGEAVDLLMEEAEEEGLEVDRSCVEDVAKNLSDDDANKLVEAGADGDVELSAEGEALTFEIFSCLDTDSFVDSIVADLGGDENVDVDCLKDVLKDVDPAGLADGDLPPGFFECIDIDIGG